MKTVLIVLTVLIIILSISLHITLEIEYDILKNYGKIKVKLFKIITVFSSGITFVGEYLNLSKRHNKVVKIKIDINDKQLQFFNDVGKYLKKKITLLNLNINTLICFMNPNLSCLLSSIINIFVSLLFSKILVMNNDVKLIKNIQTGFRQNNFIINLNASILLSIYDYFWAYLKALKNKIRREHEKNGKQKRMQKCKWIIKYS